MTKTLKFGKTPNFNDPRNRRRAEKVLAWAEGELVGLRRGRSVSGDEIRAIFSNKDQGGPAQWLFANLMQLTEVYQPGKRNNRYTIKRHGLEKIYAALDREAPSDVEILRRKYADVLTGAPLEYRDSGTRRYHQIQNIKRDLRKGLFEGWWDYDIEACAPTLIYQYAAAYSRAQHDCDLPFPAVARLVRDKLEARQYVAGLTSLDLQRTKELLNMLFFRANTAPFHKNRVFSVLGCDTERLAVFLADPFIAEFRSDVVQMWEAAMARDDQERRSSDRRPSQIKKKSKRRMGIYLGQERRVMDVITGRLAAMPILMHDGFMSRAKVDVDDLARVVRDRTGFQIRLSEIWLGSVETDIEPDAHDLMRGVSTDDD